jgi:glycosyltransferase involved in cell wall biosynthesis
VSTPPFSVVVAARNEEARLSACLAAVATLGAAEVIVVDGGSTDATVAIAEAAGARVIRSGGKGLAFDRQLGATAATCDLIAMIDADHRPEPDLIERLWDDMQANDYAVVQAGVEIAPTAFWTRAEAQAMAVFHHQPGPRSMIGVAPALYRRWVFDQVGFDVAGQEVSDDADFCYRLAQVPGVKFGIGRAKVMQEHAAGFSDYVAKFAWYGRRDAGFCLKHPERAASMFFHLGIRYPILRPLRAILTGHPRAVAWFWLAAAVRLSAAIGALRAAGQRELMGGAA